MSSWSATLYMTPRGKQRPRMTRKGHTYTPKETVSAENEIKFWLKTHNAPFFHDPVKLVVDCIFTQPKRSKLGYPYKPDVDNLLKLIMDAATGILYKDDSSVLSATVTKSFGTRDAIVIQCHSV